ncbi:MAG: carboxypeptidase-like regulatory domain-containing protein, partial [Calditrichia bacterium]|nr:carboxypeptidase-like regulatory domain-containing protein [Calditrichia bacterium]
MRNKITSNLRIKTLFFSILILIICAISLFAGTTGKIVGKIFDKETGEGLPFANVVLIGTGMGAATDINGEFLILNIPPGKYSIEASMLGYQTKTIQDFAVRVDFTSKAIFDILPETVMGEEVIVTADAVMITKDMTGSKSVIGSDEIQELPVEEVSDVLTLQAGVVEGRDGDLHIRGGRSEEIVYMVDGVPMSDVYSGDVAMEIENNSVQELQVISGTFNAEYG